MEQPLAESARPDNLAEFFGQEGLVGENGLIPRLLEKGRETGFFPSTVFWGPPGCGKTTLARIIARELGRPFFEFSAVNTSVKDIEKLVLSGAPSAKQLSLVSAAAPVLFLDEIHRFNKAQQDTLLPHVERGNILLLGATTENPSFSINTALLSRCRVVVLDRLDADQLSAIARRAAASLSLTLQAEAEEFLTRAANGDARFLLGTLEIAARLAPNPQVLSKPDVQSALQKRQLGFDLKGDEYYDTISALHKSVRGSDPNASLYWLARMLEAGQDPLYLSRRLIRMASEDIGLANPDALPIAVAAHQACQHLGLPECKLALAEAVAYLARSPKSNALYLAYQAAAEDVHAHGNLPVPLHIRNAPTGLMKDLGYGEGYDYSHSPTGTKKEGVVYFPEELGEQRYLKP